MGPKIYKKKYTNYKTATPTANKTAIHTHLIIVESPSKCKKIESYLGPHYCCIASMGHIREIHGLKSIKTKKNYEIEFENIPEKKQQVQYLQSMVQKFPKENILLATDDDREGEAIAWHICEVCDLDPFATHRIIFHEITKPALQKAVEFPTKINMNLVHAQHARQVLDMLVGFKISPVLWKQVVGDNSKLSAGRCQTPTLMLVNDNDELIQKKAENIDYKIKGLFTNKKLEFELDHRFETESSVLSFLESSKTHNHKMSLQTSRLSTRNAPTPFNTSKLLQTAHNELCMSPKETMNHCQQLYQNGWITYMRTESQKYSQEFIECAKKWITEKWDATYAGSCENIVNTSSSNPHEGIRVTHIEQAFGGKEGRESKLYHLIWKNTVKSCMSIMKLEMTPVEITSPLEGIHYKYEIEMPIFMGWKQVDNKTINIVDEQMQCRALKLYFETLVQSNVGVPYQEINGGCCIQRPHSHYSEASLIRKLEELGIGRPSTYAMLVSVIQEREYVKCMDIPGEKKTVNEYTLFETGKIKTKSNEKVIGAEKSKLVIQELGKKVLKILMEQFRTLFCYDYTRIMEGELDEISQGNKEWYKICEECNNGIKQQMQEVNKVLKREYDIEDDAEWKLVFGKNGPVLCKKSEEKCEYKSVNPKLELEKDKLKEGKYTMEELMENNHLGNYEGGTIEIKHGKYGNYVEWKQDDEHVKKVGLKGINVDSITKEKAIELLEHENENGKNMIRYLTPELSIKKGRYGAYIFHKTEHMKKPAFYPIKKFPLQYTLCDKEVLIGWIKTTYNI